ncbi:hypothetical protein ACFYOV_27315 [Streptomyces sp. NPDC005931]|uniref:hypothetical protein n=1 Tax=Streptomyces sp. NPDC005931 TaxID=3364737 RepID=UPI0036B57842
MTGTRRPRGAPARLALPSPCRGCCGIAVDLGSARTRVWIPGRGMVLDVPTVTFAGSGGVRPVRPGTVVDLSGTARLLDRLLGHRLPRRGRPLVVLTTPVLGGLAFRAAAREAVEVLRPRAVLTVPGSRAVALAAGADLGRPLLVVDIGARLTEAVLLVGGEVTDARSAGLGTGALGEDTPPERLADAVADLVTAMLRQDRTTRTRSALRRGVLLSGGGALRPDVTQALPERLGCPVRPVPFPHTAAVRGAAGLLAAARRHPSVTGTV